MPRHHPVLTATCTATCTRRPRNLHYRLAYVHPHHRSTSASDADAEPPLHRHPHSHPHAQPEAHAAARDPPSEHRLRDHRSHPPRSPHPSDKPLSTVLPAHTAANPLAAVARKARSSLRDFSRSNSVKYLIAGAIAGIVSRTAVSPLEVVATVNMCTSGATPPLLYQLRRLFATEGLRGFFKGNAANCLKVAPTKGIQFVAFEALKRLIHRTRLRNAPSSSTSTPSVPLVATERFFAGGMAGIIAATLCYPLDTAKTLLTAHPERFRGVFSTIASISRKQGPVALYRGLSPTLVAMMPYAGLDFAIYEQLKLFYLHRNKKKANLLILLFIGAFAGAVAQTACHPLDVLRKRLQLQGINGRPVRYKSMIDAAVGIVRDEGLGSLYRGLQPMYISAIPSAGVSYVVYEAVKDLLGVRSFQ